MFTTMDHVSTQKRLEEINRELEQLRTEQASLREQWSTEKLLIQNIRNLKSELEQLKQQAAEAERNGYYAQVAEIRYGKIPETQVRLDQANEQLVQLQQGQPLLKEEISAEDIAEVVAKWTGIPVQRMLETERTKLLRMEDRMHDRIVGQDEAVTTVSNAIRRSRAGLQDSKRPIGSFIFIGSTGVGKTEMARALAEFLFDDEGALVRIDMSEYMEKHAVSRLVGAPPGYVGYEEGGQLTEAVRRRPYSVVLLDEIEKAHPDVFNILLQVLDDGRLTDSQGRTVDFRNTIVIMTSNLGSELLQDKLLEITEENRADIMSGLRVEILSLLRKRLRPEFLNRVDDIILFQPLTPSEVLHIANIQIRALQKRMADNGITLIVTPECVDWLSRRGYDVQFGARPLKRVIQRYLADPLALRVLAAEVMAGDTIKADASDNGLITFDVLQAQPNT